MEIEVRAHERIGAVDRAAWNALEGASEAPFVSWDFLDVLERTGCVGEDSGWIPHHLTMHDGAELVAAAPAYIKMNSEGEFVFDHGWAGAAARARIPYYPKLVVAAPFTPATSQRLLVAPGRPRDVLHGALAQALRAICRAAGLSSAHVLFPPAEVATLLEAAGMLHRTGIQFQWRNHGYSSFEDFLARFSSKRRNQIKRERREMHDLGVKIETLTGRDLRPEIVDAAYGFYASTVEKFTWGRHYLNRAFFEEIVAKLPNDVEVVLATLASKRVAGAFNLRGRHALFGRYWGASQDVPFLHFNVCFYHSIEQCIARGVPLFEPGAGGRHKLARGFEPTLTHSAHHVEHLGLRRAVADFLDQERAANEEVTAQKTLAWR